VVDAFGFHAVQLGLPELDGLRANRMPHRWVASDSLRCPNRSTCRHPWMMTSARWHDCRPVPVAVHSEFDALPFPERASTWWCCRTRWNWHATRISRWREVERVLVPEGRV
jgi:hypothetical protein